MKDGRTSPQPDYRARRIIRAEIDLRNPGSAITQPRLNGREVVRCECGLIQFTSEKVVESRAVGGGAL